MPYVLELKTIQSAAFRTLIDTLHSILTDVNFVFYPYYMDEEHSESDDEGSYVSSDEECDEEEDVAVESDKKDVPSDKKIGGLRIMAVNKNNTILIHVKLDADKFDYYKCTRKKLVLGINLTNLQKYVKCMSNFDTITLAVDEDDVNKLIILLENAEKKEEKTFRLNLMDLEEEEIDVEPTQFPYSINLPSQDFHKYCKDMSMITDKMEIVCTTKQVFLKGKGEQGTYDVKLGESIGGLSIDVNTELGEIVQGLFEVKHLVVFTKCTSLCNLVTLYIKNDYPLVIRYVVAALGDIKLCLSPSKPKNSYD